MGSTLAGKSLRKVFGSKEVVHDVTLSMEQGEIVGLLGPNGAGKTTALECMEGLRSYDGGTIVTKGKTGIQLQSASLPTARVSAGVLLTC